MHYYCLMGREQPHLTQDCLIYRKLPHAWPGAVVAGTYVCQHVSVHFDITVETNIRPKHQPINQSINQSTNTELQSRLSGINCIITYMKMQLIENPVL